MNSWTKNVENLADGEHSLALVVKDSAGLVSDTTKLNFMVRASNITLTVDDKATSMINLLHSFTFKAKVESALPMPDSITWESNVENASVFRTEIVDSVATLVLDTTMLPEGIRIGAFYEMVARTDDGVVTNKVRFGFFNDGPVVYFESPANDTMVSVNDPVGYKVFAFHNNPMPDDNNFELSWKCLPANPCPSDKDTVGTQLSLFGDLFDEQPVTAEKPAPAAKVPAARWAELNGILNQAAYAYYALDAPEMTCDIEATLYYNDEPVATDIYTPAEYAKNYTYTETEDELKLDQPYLIGKINGSVNWSKPEARNLLTLNTEATGTEYMIQNVPLTKGDTFTVSSRSSSIRARIPCGGTRTATIITTRSLRTAFIISISDRMIMTALSGGTSTCVSRLFLTTTPYIRPHCCLPCCRRL